MKVLNKRTPGLAYDKGNTLEQEAYLTQFLSGVSKDGTRSPRYIGQVTSKPPAEMSAILMEELQAINLQKILDRKEKMPKSFNVDSFLDSLESYIDTLNNTIGIAHGDLEPRNIMVDIQTGLPRVIDFGRSSWLKAMEDKHAIKRKIDEDWKNVEKVAEKLEEFAKGLTTNE